MSTTKSPAELAQAVRDNSQKYSDAIAQLEEAIKIVSATVERLPTKTDCHAVSENGDFALALARHGEAWKLQYGARHGLAGIAAGMRRKTLLAADPNASTYELDAVNFFQLTPVLNCTLTEKQEAANLLPRLLDNLRAKLNNKANVTAMAARKWSAFAQELSRIEQEGK